MKTLLAIVMMVKNEAQAIEQTLSTYVKAGIKHMLVLDTGSTDHTVRTIQEFFKKHAIIGHVYEEPFIDFASSRNRALALAEATFKDSVFFLMPDAEWYLEHADILLKFCEQECNTHHPLYLIRIKLGTMEFTTARLFRAAARNRFQGVVHEVPETPTTQTVPDKVYFQVNASKEGKEKSKQRWHRDVELLLKSHKDHPNNPRTVFYLAQTYECLNELDKAYDYYQLRATLSGWDEENFITLFRLGGLAEKIAQKNHDLNWSHAMDYYLKAYALRPHRIEPLVQLADHYWPNNIPTCYLFIKAAYDKPYPTQDLLFIEKHMYHYTRYEIMSRCAWYMGEYALGEAATKIAIAAQPNMPHLHHNLKLYQEKLMMGASASTG